MARQRCYLSPGRVAEVLGVGESTVKRWVDENRLPAQRTAGGHRKILVTDVIRLVREENWPHVNLTRLLGESPQADTCVLAEEFHQALLAGDHDAARSLVLCGHQAGLSIVQLGDEVISPVMVRIGHGWATGELDVFQEHRGTQVALGALLALKGQMQKVPPADAPLAVGGGPEGDHYILANVLIEMMLLEMGWRVVNIGPNTPMDSFRAALRDVKPKLLWISCSYLGDVQGFVTGYASLYAEALRAETAVAVGGRALTAEVRERMTFTHHGDRLAHLAAFARQVR